MNIVIFASGERGIIIANYLGALKYNVGAVFVPLDFYANGSLDKLEIEKLRLFRIKNPNSKKVLSIIKALNTDVLISAGYNEIFKKEILTSARIGSINLHAGRLPEYRGGSPMNWQIINGETKAGISVIRLTEKLDDGVILSETDLEITASDNIATMHDKANEAFPIITSKALERLINNQVIRKQDEGLAKYWHQRCDQDGKINWQSMTAKQVSDFVRALTRPYPGAFTFHRRKKIRIFSVKVDNFPLFGTPGRVCRITGHGPLVICKNGCVLLECYEDKDGLRPKLKNGVYLN